ncbi:MAG: biopolymer transporter ExbD [Planctomycetota bacterium]
MSKVFQRGTVKPEMNMTPLIDVTFLLIVFFMLVSNIVANESVPMVVPELADPETRELGEVDKVVVNIAPATFSGDARLQSPLDHPGIARFVQVGAGSRYEMSNLAGLTEALKTEVEARPEVEVLLRADAALFYDQVQPVMDAITAAGVGVVNLVALMPDS